MKRGVIFLAFALAAEVIGMDLDSGRNAIGAVTLTGDRAGGIDSSWIRLRGIAMPRTGDEAAEDAGQEPDEPAANAEDKIRLTRDELQGLRTQGFKTCVLLRWPADWRKKYLPDDLGAAYEKGRRLGAVYGTLVDAWEIENEPDLGFVPESAERYAAYLKATYLGIKAGSREQGAGSGARTSGSGSQLSPIVLMGSLGLPPGPWLERFAANDGFSYTDGYNYHYYGYAEDFTAVYRQHEAAAADLTSALRKPETGNLKPEGPTLALRKELPVFLTEIGYGMLGKSARDTKEGRLRQWRWFKSVGEQANALRIEAPMAFYLQPYLEYDTLEFGLTQKQGAGSPEHGAGRFTAGGITYAPEDFGAQGAQPWMDGIGKKIDGNETTPALAQWLALRAGSRAPGAGSKPWTVEVAPPSPIVIDFLNGEGLSFVKRYHGSFVTGQSAEHGARSKEAGAAGAGPVAAKEPTDQQQPATKPRSEEFMIHVRTTNGNLYEVYPTRQATPDWQSYLEHQANFTLSFYGRGELPWRFGDNRPVSLVVAMYPKSLPATYEFRRARLAKLSRTQKPGIWRYGYGKLILYNFSDREISGKLLLPEGVGRVVPNAPSGAGTLETTHPTMTLAAGERREIELEIKVPADGFGRIDVPVRFTPDDSAIPPARFLTSFMPDIAGMKAEVSASLLPSKAAGGKSAAENPNLGFVRDRKRTWEEAPMAPSVVSDKVAAFAQEGARVDETVDGFLVTVTASPPGKPQRVEVEIPWPEGVEFGAAQFLSLEYRLRP